jgi:hypothetical protein
MLGLLEVISTSYFKYSLLPNNQEEYDKVRNKGTLRESDL